MSNWKASFNALAVAFSAFAAISLFWAVVLVSVIFHERHSWFDSPPTVVSTQIGSGLIGFVGVVVGWLATHFFAFARERHNRRGAFVGYLLHWRSTIARCAPNDGHNVWKAYIGGVHSFNLELGKIREDFLQSKEFISIADILGNLQPDDIIRDGKNAREPVCTPIDKLVDLVHGKSKA